MPMSDSCVFFFFNDTATTEIYTLSLHDALPISRTERPAISAAWTSSACATERWRRSSPTSRGDLSPEPLMFPQDPKTAVVCRGVAPRRPGGAYTLLFPGIPSTPMPEKRTSLGNRSAEDQSNYWLLRLVNVSGLHRERKGDHLEGVTSCSS